MTKTILLDIDGTLIPHIQPLIQQHASKNYPTEPLPGVLDKLLEWERKGYKVVLTTGRRECWRKFTEKQLTDMGIWYDQLIMDLGSGQRILINDLKPNSDKPTAIAVNLPRNQGISSVDL